LFKDTSKVILKITWIFI